MLLVEIYYKPIYLLCRKYLQVLRLFKMIYSIVNIPQLSHIRILQISLLTTAVCSVGFPDSFILNNPSGALRPLRNFVKISTYLLTIQFPFTFLGPP